jgi:uncharacterized protein YjiS (DUF1127 family)
VQVRGVIWVQLSDRDLWDLRLTRADAEREASKPFWQE